jgi:hypothetical protein
MLRFQSPPSSVSQKSAPEFFDMTQANHPEHHDLIICCRWPVTLNGCSLVSQRGLGKLDVFTTASSMALGNSETVAHYLK